MNARERTGTHGNARKGADVAIASSLKGIGWGGEWRETSLGAIAGFTSGGTPSKSNAAFWGGTIPWVSAKDMKRFRLVDSEDHVTDEGRAAGTRTATAGTVLVLTRGMTLLHDVPICIAGCDMTFNQDVKALRARAGIHPEYLAYLLVSQKHALLEMVDLAGHGTGRLNTESLKRMAVRLPPESIQEAIADILGALDDKIDLNRRMSETLEAMARALFKSWSVVDATPPRKAAELVSEGILEIGDGYRAKNSELGAPGLPFVSAGDLDSGFHLAGADVLSEESVAKAGSKAGRPGDVAFTSKGTIGRFARVDSRTPRFVYSPQVCYWRSLDRERLHPAILYCWMVGEGFRSQIDAVAGQTDMAPYVSLRDQRQMEVPVFAADQSGVGDQIEPFLERQSSLAHESETLAALRDTLLPKLISGELRIPDAERIVGEVA
jgi:type I restriction enzyme S subunit